MSYSRTMIRGCLPDVNVKEVTDYTEGSGDLHGERTWWKRIYRKQPECWRSLRPFQHSNQIDNTGISYRISVE
jgi:hypothetical protein